MRQSSKIRTDFSYNWLRDTGNLSDSEDTQYITLVVSSEKMYLRSGHDTLCSVVEIVSIEMVSCRIWYLNNICLYSHAMFRGYRVRFHFQVSVIKNLFSDHGMFGVSEDMEFGVLVIFEPVMVYEMVGIDISENRDIEAQIRVFEHMARKLVDDPVQRIVQVYCVEHGSSDISDELDVFSGLTEHLMYESDSCGFSFCGGYAYDFPCILSEKYIRL